MIFIVELKYSNMILTEETKKNLPLIAEEELKEITRTMLVSLVDRIEVSEDKEITIYYKFNILNIRKLNDEEELINVG